MGHKNLYSISISIAKRGDIGSIFNRIAYNLQHFQWTFAPFTYLNLIKCKFRARSVLFEWQRRVQVWTLSGQSEGVWGRGCGVINSLRSSGLFEWFVRRWTESISTQLKWIEVCIFQILWAINKQSVSFLSPYPILLMQHTSLKLSHAASASIIQARQSILYASRPSNGPN